MANTEGLSDEAISRLLAMPTVEEELQFKPSQQKENGKLSSASPIHGSGIFNSQHNTKFPSRSRQRREQMMDLGECDTPAATVIRSSKAPIVHSSSSSKRGLTPINSQWGGGCEKTPPTQQAVTTAGEVEGIKEIDEYTRESYQSNNASKPVMISACIKERPVVVDFADNHFNSTNVTLQSNGRGSKQSRFKRRNNDRGAPPPQNHQGNPTPGGFPSLDIAPVGAFTRKGRLRGHQASSEVNSRRNANEMNTVTPWHHDIDTSNEYKMKSTSTDDVGGMSNAMLSSMSRDEIREGVEEIKSILSAESIDFLRKRGRKKKEGAKIKGSCGAKEGICHDKLSTPSDTNQIGSILTRTAEIKLEEKRVREQKEQIAELLSSVRSPEDMERVMARGLKMGLATDIPTSLLGTWTDGPDAGMDSEARTGTQDINIHVATALLRSTAQRQQIFGARSICDILEKYAKNVFVATQSKGFSPTNYEHTKQSYPRLLPVALRCLLDESIASSQTSGGRILLSLTLRCIHDLTILFAHPSHVVCISQSLRESRDPFVLHQTCFMSEISHMPSGIELYPPTTVQSSANENIPDAYVTDSSSATADLDSKAFYSDPAWTLLSRMRILPCLSNVITCLSKDVLSEVEIPVTSISSLCGILALLAIRSPAAASAIVRHKGILPFFVTHCLSPSQKNRSDREQNSSEHEQRNGNSFFDASVARPFLLLLSTLACQSREIAQLEFPYEEIIPHLQAILCTTASNEEVLDIQILSLLLFRILLRYGLVAQHIPSLISLGAPHVTIVGHENILTPHYLMVFARICDSARLHAHFKSDINESSHCLRMSGVWLYSSLKSCVALHQTNQQLSDAVDVSFSNMKLMASQLHFLSSYRSATASNHTNNESLDDHEIEFFPLLSQESCIDVVEALLESKMLYCALEIALGWSFCPNWDVSMHSNGYSMENNAISCTFTIAFMNFVTALDNFDQGTFNEGTPLNTNIFGIVVDTLQRLRLTSQSGPSGGPCYHSTCQSWFVEAEFAVLRFLCHNHKKPPTSWNLFPQFVTSLLGRANVGHEALVFFGFNQHHPFEVKTVDEGSGPVNFGQGQSLQDEFIRELSLGNRRKIQLGHSASLYPFFSSTLIPTAPMSLRCTAYFAGKVDSLDDEKLLVPIGGIWLWKALSSSVTFPSKTDSKQISFESEIKASDILARVFGLILHLETDSDFLPFSQMIPDGTKLYHTANVCLLPEEILREDFIGSALELLWSHFCSAQDKSSHKSSTLVRDFIRACYCHSRISQECKSSNQFSSAGNKLSLSNVLIDATSSSQTMMGDLSKEELKALEDFVGDMCDSFIEYGAQYRPFSLFMRFFLRHEFPPRVISAVLVKINPILHLLTIEEEREELFNSIICSVSGGMPSVDSSRRDQSTVLDSFSVVLKKTDKPLSRHDFVYLLAVSVLTRNLTSCAQHCECGVNAMKHRLSGVRSEVLYDIMKVGELFIGAGGTRESLVSSVFDVCLDVSKGLAAQDMKTRNEWRNRHTTDIIWTRSICHLKNFSSNKTKTYK